jgi:uncharacterized protein YigA (DUF484 family)
MRPIPSFDAGEVELLVSAVQKTLERLREANERLGGNDAELMEAGGRYAVLFQKLQPVTNHCTNDVDSAHPIDRQWRDLNVGLT